MKYKITKLILLIIPLLFAFGCVSTSVVEEMAQHGGYYMQKIHGLETKDEFLAVLGEPQNPEEATLRWRHEYTNEEYESIEVTFGNSGRVDKLTHTLRTVNRFNPAILIAKKSNP